MTKREEYRECPVCSERIKAKALLCRFCGAVLTEGPLPDTVPADLARAVEDAIAKATPARKQKACERRPPGKGSQRRESFLDADEIEDIIASRYEGMDPVFALRHRRRLEEFLESSEEQYRTASVLFVDIEGYTALSERIPTGTIKEMLDSFYEVCSQAVARYNGFVVKYEGDACLAVFGAPVAYDRDAEGALRAALEIRDMVQLFPDIEGINLTVSAGVATGTILSSATTKHGRRDFDVFGPAVNLAARIQAASKKGIVLACPETHDLARNAFEFRPKRARHFKNIAKPVVIHEVLRARKPEEVSRRDFSTPFVGREPEMATIASAWEGFMERHGAGSALPGVVVSGAPGIGKSRLLTEFLQSLGSQARTVWAECSPHDANSPYAVWRMALTGLWGGSREDPAEKIETDLARYLDALGAEGKPLASDAGLIGLRAMFGAPAALQQVKQWDPGAVRRQMQADLGALLDIAGSQQTLILVLDDLQWADRSSLDLLEGLASPPAPRGVFLLLAHRSRFKIPGARLGKLERIVLHKLNEASRDELFAHLASVHEILPEIRASLLAQSSGNPLFLVELVRCVMAHLAQTKEHVEGEDLAGLIREWAPMSLKQLLESRLDLLDRRRRLVMQCGAVLGHRFAYRLINLFEMIRDGLLARLYSLKGLEFLDDVQSESELEFLFQHHLMRETAYHSLLERQRREFHRVVAQGMERAFASRLAEHYPLLAHHYNLAQDREKTIHYSKLAGDRACSQAAPVEAIEFYDSALKKLLDDTSSLEDEATAGAILRGKGVLHRFMGQCPQAFEAFDRALALPAVKSDPLNVAYLVHERALTHVYLSDYDAARKDLAVAEPKARKLKADSLLARIEIIRFHCAWGEGDWRAARKQGLKALRLASDVGDAAMEADTRNNLALLEWKAGRLEESLEHFGSALRLWRKLGNRFGIAATQMNIGIAHENLGRHAEAKRHYLCALEMTQQTRFVAMQAATLANLGNLCLVRGKWNEAMDYNARSIELARAIGDRRSEAIALENLALGNLGLARFKEAADALREGRKIARKIKDNERLFSLDLVEIELALAKPTRGSTSLRMVEAKLAAACHALDKFGYAAELPRLLRLQLQAHILAQEPGKARGALAQALRECDNQRNLSEKKRIARMAPEIATLEKSSSRPDARGNNRRK